MKPEIIASLFGTLVTAIATIIVALIQSQSKKSEQSFTLLVPDGYKIHHPKAPRSWIFVLPIALLGGIVSYFSFSWFYNISQPNGIPMVTVVPTEVPPTEISVASFNEQETLTVSFQDGTRGTSTAYEYYGTLLIVAEGVGQAASLEWSDPFYIFTDTDGQRITPWHPTQYYNWTLLINGEPVDSFVEFILPYNSNHIYKFFINAPGGYLVFAIGDLYTPDNNGYFTITIFTK
ncbi:MAG: hypothetical protein ACOYYU_16210 [Chloroflexota bacterium]